jgi:hypothetical protein
VSSGVFAFGGLDQCAAFHREFGLGEFGLGRDRGVLACCHGEHARGQACQSHRPGATARAGNAPATPAMRARLDTKPSIIPNTAGRSRPPVTFAWACISFARSRTAGFASGDVPGSRPALQDQPGEVLHGTPRGVVVLVVDGARDEFGCERVGQRGGVVAGHR